MTCPGRAARYARLNVRQGASRRLHDLASDPFGATNTEALRVAASAAVSEVPTPTAAAKTIAPTSALRRIRPAAAEELRGGLRRMARECIRKSDRCCVGRDRSLQQLYNRFAGRRASTRGRPPNRTSWTARA